MTFFVTLLHYQLPSLLFLDSAFEYNKELMNDGMGIDNRNESELKLPEMKTDASTFHVFKAIIRINTVTSLALRYLIVFDFMAKRDAVKKYHIESKDKPLIRSHQGFVDFWDGPVTQERCSSDKVKWKKRYLVMQTSPASFLHLLIYKKKKLTDVPLLNFTLSDETSTLCVGPTFKNKFTFDVSVRIGRLFMRYRFGVETEESRNKWLHELVTSYFLHTHSPHNLTYLVTPITTPQVMKLFLNGVSYLLLFKGHIELCRLSDHARLGKWPISAVHSYTTDKNVFTVKFKPNSMYGEIEIPFCSKNTIEIFRILNSLITTGEFPTGQAPGVKKPRVQPLFSQQLPDMKANGEFSDSLLHNKYLNSKHRTPGRHELKVHISKSELDKNMIAYPSSHRDDPTPSQFHTIQYPHSPERKGGQYKKPKKPRIRSAAESEQTDLDMVLYDKLSHFPAPTGNKAEKLRDRLCRTPDVMAAADIIHASNSTGNIPTIYSTLNNSNPPIEEYSVANFHRFPGWPRASNLLDQMLVRSSSEQNLFDSTTIDPIPLTKTNSLDNILTDTSPNQSPTFNPYAVVKDPPKPPRRLSQQLNLHQPLPPPPPLPLQSKQPNGYESVTLPVRGGGMKKSPTIDNNINFGNFRLEESRQWVRETKFRLDDIHEYNI